MDLKTEYAKMKSNVMQYFIFYIPNNPMIIEHFGKEVCNVFNEKLFYNHPLSIQYDSITVGADICYKISALECNYIELIERHSTLTNVAFSVFHKEYCIYLKGAIFIAELVNDNIKNDVPNCPENVLTFVNQNVACLKTHLLKVKKLVPFINYDFNPAKNLTSFVDTLFKEDFKEDFKDVVGKVVISKKIQTFGDLIIHEKRHEIEALVKIHYSMLSGVKLRYLVEYFREEGLLLLNHGDATKIHKSLQILFGTNDIGKYTTVFDKKVFDKDDDNYVKSKISFEIIFNTILKR